MSLARLRVLFRGFYRALMFMPMMMPDIVLCIALLIFFVSIGINLSIYTIIIGHCTFLTSYVFTVVSSRLADMDDLLEQASADLGANGWENFRRVTLPLIKNGRAAGRESVSQYVYISVVAGSLKKK